jgi:hypothetical protein
MHRETVGDWLSLLFFLQGAASTALLYGVAGWWRDVAHTLMWLNLMVPADTPGTAAVVEAAGLTQGVCPAGGAFVANAFAAALAIVCAAGLRAGVAVAMARSSPRLGSADAAEWQPAALEGLPRLLRFPTPECLLALALGFGLLLSSTGTLVEGCAPAGVQTLAGLTLAAVLGGTLGLRQTLERGLTTVPVGGHGRSFTKSNRHDSMFDLLSGGKAVPSAVAAAPLPHLVAFQFDRHCVAVYAAGNTWGGVLDIAYQDATKRQQVAFWLNAWAGFATPHGPVGRWVVPAPSGEAMSAQAMSAHAVERDEAMGGLELLDLGDVMSLDFDVRRVVAVAGPVRTLALVAAKLFRRNGLLVDDATAALAARNHATALAAGVSSPSGLATWTTEGVFGKWVRAVEDSYLAMPYHNSVHAADVMVTANSFLVHSGLQPRLASHISASKSVFADPNWQLAQFSLLVAAIVHDVGHVGVMNAHLKATRHPLSLEYPDVPGILEAMHAAQALKLMRAPGQNILAALAPGDSLVVRQQIVDLVLVTDLSKQAAFLQAWHAKRTPPPTADSEAAGGGATTKPRGSWDLQMDGASEKSRSDRLMFLKLLLKASDVSNPTKATPLYLFWTNRILEEFYHQGDDEKDRGLPLSPGCDRYAPNLPRGQLGFITFVVKPTFSAIKVFLDDQPPPCRRSAIGGQSNSSDRLNPVKQALWFALVVAFTCYL